MMSDLIIIGAGPGGYEMAAHAAHRGLSVLLVEKDKLGGTCLNRGCIPTKALCRQAELLNFLREAPAFGVTTGEVKVDYAVAVARKNQVVDNLRDGVSLLLKNDLITIVHGEATIVDKHHVAVDGTVHEGRNIVIATGSAPKMLPIPGASWAITSDELLEMDKLPSTLCVVGGGVIGMEFAAIFAAYGVEVSVVEYCKEILPPFDKEVAKRLRTVLSRRGINFYTQAAVTSILTDDDGLEVCFEQKGKPKSVMADKVLMAVGRQPVLPAGVSELGLTVERGAIVVDDHMMTSVEGVYAIGDVNARTMLAHAATAQGRVALAHILGEPSSIDLGVVPGAVFTQPEMAMVGLTEEQCEQQGLDVSVRKTFFRSNGKAMAMGETDGLVKMIVDNATRRVLGCHICGPHAADLIQEVALAMSAHLTVEHIASTIHGHPTLGEVLAAACEL